MRLSPLLLLAVLPFSFAHAATAPQTKTKANTLKQPAKAPAKKLTTDQIVDGLWKQSDAKFHKGDYLGAVALHRKIVALEPTDVESYSVASWLLWSLKKPADAVQFIQLGLKANPKDPEMWDAAGQHYTLQKRASDAETAFGKAVELSGKGVQGKGGADVLLRRRYAHAAREAGHLAKSITIWRALVADYPNDAVNKNNLAKVEKAAQQKGGNTQMAALASV